MSTFLEICQLARQECGMGGTGPSSTTGQTGSMAILVQRTSQAWIDIQKSKPYWKFLRQIKYVTLTVDQAEYVVADSETGDPPGFGLTTVDKWDKSLSFVYDADWGNREHLIYLPYAVWRQQIASLRTGRPKYWTEGIGGTIRFDALPDDTYQTTFDYWMTPERMVNATDVPAAPEQYHDMIAWKSVMMFAGNEGATELFTYAKSQYAPMYLQFCIDQMDVPQVVGSFPIALGRRSGPRTFEEPR